jgi:hypothetical protein
VPVTLEVGAESRTVKDPIADRGEEVSWLLYVYIAREIRCVTEGPEIDKTPEKYKILPPGAKIT